MISSSRLGQRRYSTHLRHHDHQHRVRLDIPGLALIASSAMLFLSGASLYGAMLLLPLYFQQSRGVSVLTAGLLLVPQGVGSFWWAVGFTAIAVVLSVLLPGRPAPAPAPAVPAPAPAAAATQ
jgi:hypothetical protein